MPENGDMPERADVTAEFPANALRFHDAITAHSRLGILRVLLAEPGATVQRIEERLDLSMPMIRDGVKQLRDLGYIEAENPGGRPLRYVADRSRIGQDFAALFLTLLG